MCAEFVKPFSEICIRDIALVGGKNASLGEMYSQLTEHGVKVPNGFATTSEAFWHFMRSNDLFDRIDDALNKLDVENIGELQRVGKTIRGWVMHAKLPDDLKEAVINAYEILSEEYGPHPDVAVRSSATAEDLPNASFAGQQETYLNISGKDNLLRTIRHVFASLYTDRAISYRVHQGFNHMDVALSVGVQKMVRSDLGASGVMFSIDTETGFKDAVFITSSFGLGENIVQGAVNPDEFYVYKPTLITGHRPILKRHLGEKAIKMIYTSDDAAGLSTRNIETSKSERQQFSITDTEVLELAKYATIIEEHYSKHAGKTSPMDIEWAKDGRTGELFIVQARPETVQSNRNVLQQTTYTLKEQKPPIVIGKSVGSKISSGIARVINHASEMNLLQAGEILVTDITDPDWEPVMKIASAIITNRGGRTCHAAIIARELGIPAVVGCGDATQKIESGHEVTVSCAEGDTGYIYPGILDYEIKTTQLDTLPKSETLMYLNVGNPEMAFEWSQLPSDGVGLARLEFIINRSIGVHPNALLQYESLSPELQFEIQKHTAGYKSPADFYKERLAEGIGTIAAAFYPRKVIVRLSDFKSNEYASLLGGKQFEPEEENPMIGFRGASRYPSEQFADAFQMECKALKIVRERMGLSNVMLMIPFVRTLDEARTVLKLMKENGLQRRKDELEIYLMCEIPANAILADEFLELFDGFSIGSNDLTQLTLGVDRDSGMITGMDERNPAVLSLMQMAIDACNRQNKYVGICGQAPSDFPEITEWLVEKGIRSISLNPDSLIKMLQVVADTEKKLKH